MVCVLIIKAETPREAQVPVMLPITLWVCA